MAKEAAAKHAATTATSNWKKCEKERDDALASCRSAESSLDKVNKTLAAEQKVIEALQKKVRTLEQELKNSESRAARIASLQTAAEDSERRLREAQAQASVMAKKTSTLASEKEGLAKYIRDLQQQLADQSRCSKEAVEKAEQEAKSCIQDLEKSHAEAIARLNDAREKAVESASKRSREMEATNWKAKVSALEEEVKMLKDALKQVKEELAKTKAHAEEIKALVQAANERAASATEHSKNMASLWQSERLRIEKKASEDLNEAVKASKVEALQNLEKVERKYKKEIAEAKAREDAIRGDFDRETATSSLLRERLADANNKLEIRRIQDEKSNADAIVKLETMSKELKATRKLLHDVQLAAEREKKALKAQIKNLESQVKSYAEVERRLNATLKQVETNNKRCQRLQKERDEAVAAANEASKSKENENEIKRLSSKIKVLNKKLEESEKARRLEARDAERDYQSETERLVAKHKSQLANLKTKLSVALSDLKRAIQEAKAAREKHERELSENLSVHQAEQEDKNIDRIAKLKKNEDHHKRTIATQVERLKQLRQQLEDQKRTFEESKAAFKEKEITLEMSVKKLKSICAKLKSKNSSSELSGENLEDRITKAESRIEEQAKLCEELSAAVAAEAKGSGYLSNLNVLIKTAEAAQYQKKVTQLKKELHNAKKVHSVLMYNVKYGEKALAKFDKKAAKKQVTARTDSLFQLEKDIEESRKKEKRFQETSDANVDELETLKKGAKKKLISARDVRKDLCQRIEHSCKLLLEELRG